MTTNNNILEQANKIVNMRSEEQNRNYGDFNDSMDKMSKLASVMCGKEITTIDCYHIMNALKLSREAHKHKEDNLLDLVAYTGALNNYYNTNTNIKRKIDSNIKYKILKDVWEKGNIIKIRSLEVKELCNYSFTINPYDRFFNFEGRKMNLQYIKEELKWYFRRDKKDLSICEHAKIWKMLVNEDKTINSNYGHLIFNGQFDGIIKTLIKDKNSRRAVLMLGNKENYMSDTKDYICTMSLVFQIRNNKLNAYCYMRSNDIIFGLTNDIPFFTILQEMIYITLKDKKYKDLEMGTYTHTATSMHLYKRHYKMVKNILSEGYEHKVECPKIKDSKEVELLLNPSFEGITHDFYKWLYL